MAVGEPISIFEDVEGSLTPDSNALKDDTINVNVMSRLQCVEQRVAKRHFMVSDKLGLQQSFASQPR